MPVTGTSRLQVSSKWRVTYCAPNEIAVTFRAGRNRDLANELPRTAPCLEIVFAFYKENDSGNLPISSTIKINKGTSINIFQASIQHAINSLHSFNVKQVNWDNRINLPRSAENLTPAEYFQREGYVFPPNNELVQKVIQEVNTKMLKEARNKIMETIIRTVRNADLVNLRHIAERFNVNISPLDFMVNMPSNEDNNITPQIIETIPRTEYRRHR